MLKKARKISLAGAGVIVLMVGVIVAASLFWVEEPATAPGAEVARVAREPMVLLLSERGVLRPAKVEAIKSRISSNQAQLIWSVEEGEAVSKGQIVARFDTKPFADRMERAEQDLADVLATLSAAKKTLAVRKVEADGRIEAAERKLDIARISAEDLLNGSGQLQLRKIEQTVAQRERELAIARKEVADMEALIAKGHISRRELESAENILQTARDGLALATAELENFTRYEWPRMTREAELVVEAAVKDLEQAKRTSELELQRAEGDILKLQRDLARAETRLQSTMADVAACDVRAPIDGTILYKEIPQAEGRRKVQIGDSVWVGQTFMEIPDTSEMVVELFVREIDVAKLKKGLPATIELDALPGQTFSGEVEMVHSLATENRDTPGLRTFRTLVRISEVSPEMYAGMSARVDIRYRELDGVLTVPVGAILYENGKTFVRQPEGEDGVTITPVTLGESTAEKIHVLAGLAEGEPVFVGGQLSGL